MSISLHDFVVAELQARKGTWPKIARDTNIPRGSLRKIGDGTWKNPGVRHIETLAAYFRARRDAA